MCFVLVSSWIFRSARAACTCAVLKVSRWSPRAHPPAGSLSNSMQLKNNPDFPPYTLKARARKHVRSVKSFNADSHRGWMTLLEPKLLWMFTRLNTKRRKSSRAALSLQLQVLLSKQVIESPVTVSLQLFYFIFLWEIISMYTPKEKKWLKSDLNNCINWIYFYL